MEWFNDHKYNNNLVRVQFKSRKEIYIFLQIVLGSPVATVFLGGLAPQTKPQAPPN